MQDRITQLESIIQDSLEYNRSFINNSKESLENDRQLKIQAAKLKRIGKALNIRPAVGVFGQSQCGKSFLISELTGGKDTPLLVEGVENKSFQDFNQQNADAETTAVVTRFTDTMPANLSDNCVRIRLLSPVEVMWSFVYGFYHELNYTSFELDDEKTEELVKKIKSNDTTNPKIPDNDYIDFELGFSECVRYVKETFGVERTGMAEIAQEHISQNNDRKMSYDRLILIASTLWNCDVNITKAFKSRIMTLKYYGNKLEIDLDLGHLKDILDASKMANIQLDYNKKYLLPLNKKDVFKSSTDENLQMKLSNIQILIKEVILPVSQKNDSIISKMDVLDFPGARAMSGQDGSYGKDDIIDEIQQSGEPAKSSLLANVIKRGKLLYLFELYCKNFDITILALCSQHGTQEAPIIRKMVTNWIKKHTSELDKKTPALFAVLTKSDLLLKGGPETEADVRLTKRFEDNFAGVYGSWVDDWLESNGAFKNFYLVRNPQADLSDYTLENGKEQWRQDGKEKMETLFAAWKKNKSISNYLTGNTEAVFKDVFFPGSFGILKLKQGLVNRFTLEPDKKNGDLERGFENIKSETERFNNNYYSDPDKSKAEAKEKEEARAFLNKLRKNTDSISILLNKISARRPGLSTLDEIINEVEEKQQQNRMQIAQRSPLHKGVPEYVKHWMKNCGESDIHNELLKCKILSGELSKYFLKLTDFLLSESVMDNFLEDIGKFFPVEEGMSHKKSIANYISWYFGQYIYYLGMKNGVPEPEGPYTMPEKLNIQEYLLEIWDKNLPEIFADNFEMRPPAPGNDVIEKNIARLKEL